jgi:Homeodomain-like domain
MPATTILDIPTSEQDQILATLRRARYGYLLALHVLLLCAAGHNPTEIATFLFCSRSSVYRIARAYRNGTLGLRHDDQGNLLPPVRTTVLMPWLKRALLALLQAAPGAMAGAARAGAVPRWPRPSSSSTAWTSPRRRSGVGSTRSAGCGDGLI